MPASTRVRPYKRAALRHGRARCRNLPVHCPSGPDRMLQPCVDVKLACEHCPRECGCYDARPPRNRAHTWLRGPSAHRAPPDKRARKTVRLCVRMLENAACLVTRHDMPPRATGSRPEWSLACREISGDC